jgi:NitT/TauT family transport system substrate-binding protein
MPELLAMMNDPEIDFTLQPRAMQLTAEFMHRIGTVPVRPESWKDLFFDNVHALGGS